MKKLAIYCLVLAMAVVFVPASQAAQYCLSFTNFCDSVQIDFANVGGITGNLSWGDWDWECGFGTTSTIGQLALPKLTEATRAVDAGSGYPSAYSTLFVFKGNKQGGNFDLSFTCGLDCGFTGFFQTNQPYTVTPGTCGLAPNNGKPRLTESRFMKRMTR